MHKIYLRQARVGSAECWGIQILTEYIYFNSFRVFWDTLYIPLHY